MLGIPKKQGPQTSNRLDAVSPNNSEAYKSVHPVLHTSPYVLHFMPRGLTAQCYGLQPMQPKAGGGECCSRIVTISRY